MSLEPTRGARQLEAGVAEPGEPRFGPGALVANRYRLETILGRGGAATVWRAHDSVLDRAVALKALSPYALRRGEVTYERFLREARICAAIRHPNVVGLLDFGADHERPFLVMELLEGEPLDVKLDREVQLRVAEAVAIAAGILDGLEAAHEAGIVHRDLKPANVFLVREGDTIRSKLLDFGVSRSLDRALRRSAYTTAEGQLLGTPEYMSPEQARGTRDLDFRTDLYSAGVIVFEMLAGILPYSSDALGDLIVEIVTRPAPPLSSVRPDVGPISDVLARAMAHKRDARFASAREMRDALLAAAEELRIDPTAPTLPPASRRDEPSDPTLRVDRPLWEETTIVRPVTASTAIAPPPIRRPSPPPSTSAPPSSGGDGRASVVIGLVCIALGLVVALFVRERNAEAVEPEMIVSGPHVEELEAVDPAPPPASDDVRPERPQGEVETPRRPRRRRAEHAEHAEPRHVRGIIRELDY